MNSRNLKEPKIVDHQYDKITLHKKFYITDPLPVDKTTEEAPKPYDS